MITVSCIIPACNEAARIGKVLDVVRNHPLLFEIIVVDDGSADNTADVAREKGVRVVRLATNQGKSHAVAEGIAAATGSHLLMLDADLLEACIQSALSTADQDKERQAEEAMSKQHTAEEQMR